jgi:hypothetical protein
MVLVKYSSISTVKKTPFLLECANKIRLENEAGGNTTRANVVATMQERS